MGYDLRGIAQQGLGLLVLAFASAAQTALGVTNRGLMSLVLDRSGYADMAKAYVPFDGMAMLADGILGAGIEL